MSGPPQLKMDSPIDARPVRHGAGAMSGPPQLKMDSPITSRAIGHGAGARLASRSRRRGERI
jgi:BRCT domain type II-containing protein